MTEDLRALMRSELSEERPPPLGDLIATAMLDGRRIARRRRYAMAGVSAAVVGVLLAGAAVAWPSGDTQVQPAAPAASPASPAPLSRPPSPSASPSSIPASSEPSEFDPTVVDPSISADSSDFSGLRAKTWTVRANGQHDSGKVARATPQAVLELLTQLLPKGKLTNVAANADDGLFAQVYLDTGKGPGMIRVWLKPYEGRDLKPGTVAFEAFPVEGNCVQSTVIGASYATGGHLEMNIATCLGSDEKPARPALSLDEAVTVLSDARWGSSMDAELVDSGNKRFADVPANAE
ncbi:hypothetical protein [Actinoplanes sp. TFC3]|uniref:hypothetical protein n=1 Tax=Actinoplanes sp. TFC3 TaxID=1710355 RepID=UPI00082D76A1|nr:hypothetical protein [Actinoplanes sp. TFC3]